MGNINACNTQSCAEVKEKFDTIIAVGVPCESSEKCQEHCHSSIGHHVSVIYSDVTATGDENAQDRGNSPIQGQQRHHVDHDSVVQSAVMRLVLTARKPWPPATMNIVQERWYKRGGMSMVMHEFFSYHCNRPDGEMQKMRLNQKQMAEVRNLLEASGELEEVLEAKIKANMPESLKKEMHEAKVKEFIADDSRYTTWPTLKTALEGNAVALIKADWLMKFGMPAESRLPKRQSLEEDATRGKAATKGAMWIKKQFSERLGNLDKKTVALVSISYCWRSPEHPDPDGEQLHLLAALVREFAGPYGGPTWHGEVGHRTQHEFCDLWQPVEGADDVAIFIDWCSLYQKPRTQEEEDSFAKALTDIEIWYAHRGTHVWMLTAVPEGVFTAGDKMTSDAEYQARGWPNFEHCVSTLIKDREMVFDMGKLPPLWRRWLDVVNSCKAARFPPKSPHYFETELRTKRFSYKNDCRILIEKYEKCYNRAICKAKELTFSGVTWHPIQIIEVGALLPQCFQLHEFSFHSCVLSEDGGCILAKAAPTCRTLVSLKLFDNVLSDRTAMGFGATLHSCQALRHLCLHLNDIGDEGGSALAAALPESNLTVLRLDNNKIGSKGGAAFAQVFRECDSLKNIILSDNMIPEERKQSLNLSWVGAGKAPGNLATHWASYSLHERSDFSTVELEKYGGIIL